MLTLPTISIFLFFGRHIALVGYFALLCTTSSIIQQIYNYTLWNDLAWAQLHYIKANYENADVIFNNGNFGFMRVLAIIRLFCYIVESSYLLAYCIRVTMTMYNFWATRRDGERIAAVVGRVAPIILAAITIGLLQTPAVQSSFTAYMFVANVQLLAVSSCAISIVLLAIVIRQYVQSKLAWKRVQTTGEPGGFWSRLKNNSGSSSSSKDQSTITAVYTEKGTVFDNNWVVIRLSIAVVLISAFIVANIVTHLPQRDDVARDAKADAPDLGPERARSNIIGYIFGVTPGLAIWIVFGLTRDFRQIMYKTFIPRSWRRTGSAPQSPLEASWNSARERQQADLSGVAVDTGLQLDNINIGAKRRPSPDTIDAPLLISTSTPRLTPSNRSVSRDEQISIG
ncbi:hypothetical protein NUW58_g8109 [Xylaria curta]|uniref:Uncharacterized protein n=1 Tax=Xylaria curta TaxID=42375 RepID=A0ACC1NBF0_9PEZI|nr:hypothetical protein NUW58_g8109 [Xylaria curta]